MGSADKLVFLIKDMICHLSRTYKKNLNPNFVSKLDLFSVHHFDFTDLTKLQLKQSQHTKVDVIFNRNFIETQLQNKNTSMQ